MHMIPRRPVTGIAVALAAIAAVAGPAAASTRPPYGCFKVTVDALNIRAQAFSTASIVAEVARDDILIKRHRFCTLRGFWCAVTTEKGVAGYADKSMIEIAPCPARLSRD